MDSGLPDFFSICRALDYTCTRVQIDIDGPRELRNTSGAKTCCLEILFLFFFFLFLTVILTRCDETRLYVVIFMARRLFYGLWTLHLHIISLYSANGIGERQRRNGRSKNVTSRRRGGAIQLISI